jgi:ribonuclease HI
MLHAGFQSWLPNWRRNGFRTADGGSVKNASLIRYLSAHLDARALYGQQVRMKYVKGHSGEEGNEGADAEANKGTILPAVPERDWEKLEVELRERMEVEQTTRPADQRIVPTEVDVDDLPTGNAMKVRKLSNEEMSAAPAKHAGSSPEANALPIQHVDSSSTSKLDAPPSSVEAIDITSPTETTLLPTDTSDLEGPSAAIKSNRIEIPLLPMPAAAGSSTLSSPRKIAESTSRIMAAIRLPSKEKPSQYPKSPRRATPLAKVSSVMQTLFPPKSASAQTTSSSPIKNPPSPRKFRSKFLARSPSKTIYSKDLPASSSSMAQQTQEEDSQPSQTSQSTNTESFVTALTTIIPTSVDSPSTAPAVQPIQPSLPEQSAKEDLPESSGRIVVDMKDVDVSVRIFCVIRS